ncbi:MAG TPA: hypothetical protein VN885_01015, partial [Candidatus Acidoferrales bacterium]|nr:hypothetical protein [Candidatus Acidoferrales bacterium]
MVNIEQFRNRHLAWKLRGLVDENHVEEGTVHGETAVVLDETEPPEFIHEEADPRPSGSHHFGKRFLADLGKDGFGLAGLPVLREKKKRAGEAFFAGIEKLIHQIGFETNVARQNMRDESLRKSLLLAKHPHHG